VRRRPRIGDTAGIRVTAVAGDVTDPDCARRVVEVANERHSRLDVLVNDAGILRFGHSHDGRVLADRWIAGTRGHPFVVR
jgi:NAD(P)-dependent dehydrogenase (short-subunit alcohol dehydrogenase family)